MALVAAAANRDQAQFDRSVDILLGGVAFLLGIIFVVIGKQARRNVRRSIFIVCIAPAVIAAAVSLAAIVAPYFGGDPLDGFGELGVFATAACSAAYLLIACASFGLGHWLRARQIGRA